eukprot:GHVL01025287.1.p1 GENE.GHVL01025287.1~~GHVL01025287.1.p1  ORF type:complete len:145 (+),score=10.02 GHVL01025287.1:84-518(+)
MALSVLFSFAFASAMATAVHPATLGMTTPKPGCLWGGKMWPAGQQFKPNPCTFCNCVDGRAACAVADCAPPQCVDYVRDPNQCCPKCPNGSNCRAPDGTIIPAGKNVHINANTVCSCAGSGGFMMTSDALCSVTDHTVTPQVVN